MNGNGSEWNVERARLLLAQMASLGELKVRDDEDDSYLDGIQARWTVMQRDEEYAGVAWTGESVLAQFLVEAPAALCWALGKLEEHDRPPTSQEAAPAEEGERPADPFAPNWKEAPVWAEYHTVDWDGTGTWWSTAGIVLGADAWYHDEGVLNRHWLSRVYDPPYERGLDWRNSLRARPNNL